MLSLGGDRVALLRWRSPPKLPIWLERPAGLCVYNCCRVDPEADRGLEGPFTHVGFQGAIRVPKGEG